MLILDPQLTSGNIISINADFKKDWSLIPVLVLSEQRSTSTITQALDAGADDYIFKPFGILELAARIRVAIRHIEPATPQIFSTNGLSIDLTRKIVKNHV